MDQIVERQLPGLVRTFQQLHAHPELSYHEMETARFMAEELQRNGCSITDHFGRYESAAEPCYGVVAVMQNGAGPTVLVRADMDALPVTEKSGLPYASTICTVNDAGEAVGAMHACGHDLHSTLLLGVARTMYELRPGWSGTLVLIAQPAEEVGDSGGFAMLRAGLYEKFPRPDYALAFHANPWFAAGQVGYVPGPAMAFVTSVDIIIRGVSAHGASPHRGIDPVVLSAQTILALQTIISRELDPLDSAVLTIGSIHGGTARNIIPGEVTLQATLRCYRQEVRDHLIASISRICENTARAAGVAEERLPEVRVLNTVPAVLNDPELTERVRTSMSRILGAESLRPAKPVMIGEDFSAYADSGRVPAALFWLGVSDPQRLAHAEREGKEVPGLHSPQFVVAAEPALRTGIKAMTAALIDLMPR